MEIAHGGGHCRHPDTGFGALNGAGIVAAGDIFLGLPGNMVVLSQITQLLEQRPVIDGATIHIGDDGALAGGADLAVGLNVGQIGGGGGLQHQRDPGRDGEGSAERAAGHPLTI